MASFTFVARDEVDTQRLGQALARILPKQVAVGLSGTLGAGKTRLVQAIAEASGVPRDLVVSPTFTLCNEYQGDRRIYHLDLYRVRDEDELIELGIEDYLQAEAMTIVEWADRFPDILPPRRWEISIDLLDQHARAFQIANTSAEHEALLKRLQETELKPS